MFYPLPLIDFSDFRFWFKFWEFDKCSFRWHNSGAEALAEICKDIFLIKKRTLNILIPSYFCGQSLSYLRSLNAELHFYKLNKDFTPNLNFINDEFGSIKFDIFLNVHYFGKFFINNEFISLAKKQNAIVIDDCAHIVSPLTDFDFKGDFLIFSPHKHFPLPKVAFSINKANSNNSYANKFSYSIPLGWLIKQILKKSFRRKLNTEWRVKFSSKEKILNNFNPSIFTVNASLNYVRSFDEINLKRKKNKDKLIKRLSNIPKWSPLLDIENLSYPYLLGMICDDEKVAKKRFKLLNKKYPYVMQWPDLPNELLGFKSNLNDECITLVKRTIFFFIHQKINQNIWLKEIDNLIKNKNFI